MFSALLARSPGTTSAATTRRPTPSFAPRMEGLEDRSVPAITSITQDLGTKIATITANNAADTINVRDLGAGNVWISGTGLAQPVNLDASIRTVRVRTQGGADTVNYNLVGNVTRPTLTVDVDLGNGNDRFTANMNGRTINTNSTVHLKVNGNSGSDALTVNAGTAALPTNVRVGGKLKLDLVGGGNFDLFDAADTIAARYQGELDGHLESFASGGLGNDTMTALFTLNPGSGGRVKGLGTGSQAVMDGGFGADRLDFRVRVVNAPAAGVSAQVRTGVDLSPDTVRRTTNVLANLGLGDTNIFVS